MVVSRLPPASVARAVAVGTFKVSRHVDDCHRHESAPIAERAFAVAPASANHALHANCRPLLPHRLCFGFHRFLCDPPLPSAAVGELDSLGVLASGFGQRFWRAAARLRLAALRLPALGRSLMPRRRRARACAALFTQPPPGAHAPRLRRPLTPLPFRVGLRPTRHPPGSLPG